MKKHALIILLAFSSFSPVVSTPQATLSENNATSLSTKAITAACLVGGALALYKIYTWHNNTSNIKGGTDSAPCVWSAAVIKKEAESLIRNQKMANTQPIFWEVEPQIPPNVPINQGMVEITAALELSKQNHAGKWFMERINFSQSDNLQDLRAPGILKIKWFLCDSRGTGPEARATGELSSDQQNLNAK